MNLERSSYPWPGAIAVQRGDGPARVVELRRGRNAMHQTHVQVPSEELEALGRLQRVGRAEGAGGAQLMPSQDLPARDAILASHGRRGGQAETRHRQLEGKWRRRRAGRRHRDGAAVVSGGSIGRHKHVDEHLSVLPRRDGEREGVALLFNEAIDIWDQRIRQLARTKGLAVGNVDLR